MAIIIRRNAPARLDAESVMESIIQSCISQLTTRLKELPILTMIEERSLTQRRDTLNVVFANQSTILTFVHSYKLMLKRDQESSKMQDFATCVLENILSISASARSMA